MYNRLKPGDRFVHDPIIFSYEDNKTDAGKVEITEVGRVIITKNTDNPNEVDEVEIPASLIFKIGSMLRNTRKIVNAGKD